LILEVCDIVKLVAKLDADANPVLFTDVEVDDTATTSTSVRMGSLLDSFSSDFITYLPARASGACMTSGRLPEGRNGSLPDSKPSSTISRAAVVSAKAVSAIDAKSSRLPATMEMNFISFIS
jgi:hypothetical protein